MEDINVDNVDNVDNGAMENKEEAPQVMETCNGGESLDLAQPQDANIRIEGPISDQERIQELESENESLRRQVRALKRSDKQRSACEVFFKPLCF